MRIPLARSVTDRRPKAPSKSWYSLKRRSTMSIELCQSSTSASLMCAKTPRFDASRTNSGSRAWRSTITGRHDAAHVQRDGPHALSFLDALELHEIDVLGYSIGGFVAQELTLIRPQLVRRIVLAGTGPEGGEQMHRWTDDIFSHAILDEPGGDDLLALFFERSDTSVAKGWEQSSSSASSPGSRTATSTPAWRPATPSSMPTPPGASPTPAS